MGSSDEVRRLLDERGIKWWALESDPNHLTECVVDGVRYKFRQQGRGIIVSTCTEGPVTPEQAIAATVGAGTCHVKAVKKLGDLFGFRLSCEHSMVNPFNDRPDYCPWCGRRVIEEVTE